MSCGHFHLASGDADIAVIEGAMGLFDGIDGTDFASTAHVARILHAPVILVVDIKGMSRSVLALIGDSAGLRYHHFYRRSDLKSRGKSATPQDD